MILFCFTAHTARSDTSRRNTSPRSSAAPSREITRKEPPSSCLHTHRPQRKYCFASHPRMRDPRTHNNLSSTRRCLDVRLALLVSWYLSSSLSLARSLSFLPFSFPRPLSPPSRVSGVRYFLSCLSFAKLWDRWTWGFVSGEKVQKAKQARQRRNTQTHTQAIQRGGKEKMPAFQYIAHSTEHISEPQDAHTKKTQHTSNKCGLEEPRTTTRKKRKG